MQRRQLRSVFQIPDDTTGFVVRSRASGTPWPIRAEQWLEKAKVCELFCLSSRLPTRAFSLHKFASAGRTGERHRGWGVANYEGEMFASTRSQSLRAIALGLASSKGRCSQLSHSVPYSPRHQRRISLANTQPFVRELGGRMHLFAHNGRLEASRADMPESGSASDRSEIPMEIAFCILLERLSSSVGRWPRTCD